MRRRDHDVIVVGSGPAGGTAAYELASKGVRVLVLEKERLPRYKPCAGGFPLKAAQALSLDVSPAYEMAVTKGKCTYRGRSQVSMDFGEVVGWTVMRDKLDHLIVEEASRAGTEVVDSARVTGVQLLSDRAVVTTERHEYSGRIVVGADGTHGIVGRSVGLVGQRRLAVTMASEIAAKEDFPGFEEGCVHFDFGTVPWGYGWVFPKKNHLSVGVGVFRARAKNLTAILTHFLRQLGFPPRVQETARMRGHLVPLGGRKLLLHRERVLLLGDAASLAEPLTGEGIYYAIKSAKLGADTVYHALTNDCADLSTYTERVNAQIVKDFRYAHRLARLLYRFPRFCFYYFARSPLVRYGLADVLCGRSTFERLFYRLLRNGPRILLLAS